MKRLLAFPLVRLLLIALLFGVLATPVVFAAKQLHGPWIGIAITWILAVLLLAATCSSSALRAAKRYRT